MREGGTVARPRGRCAAVTSGLREPDFEAALGGTMTVLQLSDGCYLPLSAHRWYSDAEAHDRWLLDRCASNTIDLGCGPGRLVGALTRRGVRALGIDVAKGAIDACAANGVPAAHRDVFGPLPAEGTWRRVLLADGNIGIGGDPCALLTRSAALLATGGTILVELAEPRVCSWSGSARLTDGWRGGRWFPWALVGAEDITAVAGRCGLRVTERFGSLGRYFAELATEDAYA